MCVEYKTPPLMRLRQHEKRFRPQENWERNKMKILCIRSVRKKEAPKGNQAVNDRGDCDDDGEGC